MTLTELKQKPRHLIMLLAIVVLFLVIVFLLLDLSKPKVAEEISTPINYNQDVATKVDALPITQIDENITLTQTSLQNIQINLPDNLPEQKNITLPQFYKQETNIDDYARTFEFGEKLDETTYVDRWTNSSLSFDQYSQTFNLVIEPISHSHNEESLRLIKIDVAQERVETFIQQKLQINSEFLTLTNTEYLIDSGAHYEEVSPEQAEFIRFYYDYQLNGETFYPNFQNPEAAVWVIINQDYKVVQARFTPYNFTPAQNLETPLISVQQSLQTNNFAYFNYMYDSDGYPVNPYALRSITVETVEIQNHISEDNGITYPFYVMKGEGITTNNEQISVEFKIPATVIVNQ